MKDLSSRLLGTKKWIEKKINIYSFPEKEKKKKYIYISLDLIESNYHFVGPTSLLIESPFSKKH